MLNLSFFLIQLLTPYGVRGERDNTILLSVTACRECISVYSCCRPQPLNSKPIDWAHTHLTVTTICMLAKHRKCFYILRLSVQNFEKPFVFLYYFVWEKSMKREITRWGKYTLKNWDMENKFQSIFNLLC